MRALFLNCTLKRTPRVSHTRGLMDDARAILTGAGVDVDVVRVVDHRVPPGVHPDMTAHGWDADEWPGIQERVWGADIVVVGTPIWLGEPSSVCRTVIERLYAHSAEVDDRGLYRYYGKVAGCVVTGNEDGVKHCAKTVTYALQHLGFTIPPQADTGWIGEIGPGPSFLDPDSGGPESDFTQRTTTFMAWNLIHLARAFRAMGGFPAHGNQPEAWAAGEAFGHPRAGSGIRPSIPPATGDTT